MKHLKHINELFKGTYKSAAKKLMSEHPGRANIISQYAEERGENKKIDRIYPYKFTFHSYNESPDEYFFITGSETKVSMTGDQYRCQYFVIFESNYSNYREIVVRIKIDNMDSLPDTNYDLKSVDLSLLAATKRGNTIQTHTTIDDEFKFDNRESAISFKKFILEQLLESKELNKNIHQLYTPPTAEQIAEFLKAYPINNLYKTKEIPKKETTPQKKYTWTRSIG